MEEIVFKDQSLSDLRLNLIAGEPDLDELTVIETKQLSLPGGARVVAGILGASHFATIRFGNQRVSEVFVCAELRTELPRIFFGPLGAVLKKIVLTLDGQIRYMFEAEIVTCSEGLDRLNLLERRIEKCRREDGAIGLTFEFPGAGRAVNYSAKTAVLAWINDQGAVMIETAHCYPKEEGIVFTRSEVQKEVG